MRRAGSTNLLITLSPFGGPVVYRVETGRISQIWLMFTPLLARVYPKVWPIVNHFHAAGGLGFY